MLRPAMIGDRKVLIIDDKDCQKIWVEFTDGTTGYVAWTSLNLHPTEKEWKEGR